MALPYVNEVYICMYIMITWGSIQYETESVLKFSHLMQDSSRIILCLQQKFMNWPGCIELGSKTVKLE